MNTKTKTDETQGLVLMQGQAESLIAKAIDKNVSVETMAKLLAMRRELQEEWAKRRFDEAMAAFQAECPVIEKTKKVDFVSRRTGSRTTYCYAPLDEIVRQVKEALGKHGFSYTIETQKSETGILSVITVHHIDGHSEATSFEVPIDREAYMNAQQQYGAASTFSKRYAFCNAFGILTGDEDTDADTASSEQPESPQEVGINGSNRASRQTYQTALATPAQVSFIEKLLRRKGHEAEEICMRFGIGGLNELTVPQASTVIDRLKALPDAKQEGEGIDDGYRAQA
jgi:hypothetical protein